MEYFKLIRFLRFDYETTQKSYLKIKNFGTCSVIVKINLKISGIVFNFLVCD